MADPVTLAMAGAAAGAALSPKDPLTGAMMGGAAGFGGGALMGPAAAGGAVGTGIGAGGASLPGVMGAANTAAGAAAGTALPIGFTTNAALPSMIPGAAQTAFGSLAPTAGGVIGGGAAAPGFGQQALNFMNQNPTLTNQGFNLANNMMQEEPTQYAPPGQVSRGGPIQANDYMSLLAPQQSPVIMPQRLSLI